MFTDSIRREPADHEVFSRSIGIPTGIPIDISSASDNHSSQFFVAAASFVFVDDASLPARAGGGTSPFFPMQSWK